MYFKCCGEENTEKTIELAVKTAKERGIKYIVTASTTGKTARLLIDTVENIVVVPYACGIKAPGVHSISEEEIKFLQDKGIKICIASHVLSGAERAISRAFGGVSSVEVMAHTLRMLGQGVKVCVEISTMAIDGGYIPYGEDIIAIGGSSHGADTAVIMRPEHANNILQTKIKEIICKPSEF